MDQEKYSQNITGIESEPLKKPRSYFSRCLTLIISTIILLALSSFAFYFIYYYQTCRIPKKYSIGEIDKRFKVSRDEVLNSARDAESRWDDQSGKNIFEYDTDSAFKINLIYDDRQAKLDQMNAEVSKINTQGGSIEEFRSQLDIEISKYQTDLNDFNSQVSYWNSQGGAPPAEYQALEEKKISLQNRQIEINKKASLLNLQIDEHNSNLSEVKSQIDAEKNKIVTQGEYRGNEINIYTFGNLDELRLVLMHELGHSLTKEHASDSKSIMYYILKDQDVTNPLLSSEDITLVKDECRIK